MSYPKYRVIECPFVDSESWWRVQKKFAFMHSWNDVLFEKRGYSFATQKEAEEACRCLIAEERKAKEYYDKYIHLRKKAKIIPIK